MQNIICNITEEDILKVELYCGYGDNDLIDVLKSNVENYMDKSKVLMDCYFTLVSILNGHDSSLNLQYLRVITTDNESYQISSYEMIKNKLVVSDNLLRLMFSVVNYIFKQENLSIKVLDIDTMEYVDYQYDDKVSIKKKVK